MKIMVYGVKFFCSVTGKLFIKTAIKSNNRGIKVFFRRRRCRKIWPSTRYNGIFSASMGVELQDFGHRGRIELQGTQRLVV